MSESKAQPIVGIILTALDVLLLVGLNTSARPCAHADAVGCQAAQRAVLGAGVVLLVLAAIRIFELDEGERRGLSLGSALVGALIAVLPGMLVPLCADASMPCNQMMRPFVLAVGAAAFFTGAVDLTRRLLALRTQ